MQTECEGQAGHMLVAYALLLNLQKSLSSVLVPALSRNALYHPFMLWYETF
jgi:hypothetical protein